MAVSFNRAPGTGETRDCTDPWSFVILRSNGDVNLCCRSEVVGNVNRDSMDEILASEAARAMRRGLLSGELSMDCLRCSERGVISLAGLRARVEHELADSTMGEIQRLRAEQYSLREERAALFKERAALTGHARTLEAEVLGLRGHAKTIEEELDSVKGHARNLEDERPHLVGHIANLERELELLGRRLDAKRNPLKRVLKALSVRRDKPS